MARFQNILETIGNTPVVKLNKLAPPGVNTTSIDREASHVRAQHRCAPCPHNPCA